MAGTTTPLPIGARVFKRGAPTESFEAAERLARAGASDSAIVAAGGDDALVKIRQAEASTNGHGNRADGNGSQSDAT